QREGVFAVADTSIGLAYLGLKVKVTLKSDPNVSTIGSIREMAPNADPVTRTYAVRVALPQVPDAIRLGGIVPGRPLVEARPALRIPTGALLQSDKPAVWVVEGADRQVQKRPVKVMRFDTDSVLIAEGLKKGDIVVTAGVNSLAEGQKVRLPADLGK